MSPEPAEALCRLSETYGRAICREPQKVEAMLRDLCPEYKREIFLLVSAMKEQIVPDLMSVQSGSVGGVPLEVIVSRSRHKLAENLGFTEESASWAVDSWLQASRILAAAPDVPLPVYGPSQPVDEDRTISQLPQSGLDWIWLILCLVSLASAGLGVFTVAWFAIHHDTPTLKAWAIQTGFFTLGLAVSLLGIFAAAGQFRKRRIPNHWIANPGLGAAAMLCEMATVLTLPLVPVLTVAIWAGEWSEGFHAEGHPHDLAFHLARILQSLLLIVFEWRWLRASVAVLGRLSNSAIGRRR
jgi:hypothetical protein